MTRSLILVMMLAGLVAHAVRAATVQLNADGVLVVDGKKLFPIGFTMPPPPDGRAPSGKHAYEELRSAGAAFLRTGAGHEPWDEAAIREELKYQEAAAQFGMYCMPYLRDLASIGPHQPEREAMLRKLVAAVKGQRAMAIWKGADEPNWAKLPVANVTHVRETLRELDARHPVWIVQAPRGTVQTMRAYDPAYDITGVDIYPIGYPPGTHSLLENKEISMVGDYTKMMREVAGGGAGGGKPVWMTLQIAWSGVDKPGKTLRMPTFPQERFMAYQAIINGARGLIFYGGQVRAAWARQDAELGWNWSFWHKALRAVVEEIGDRGPLAEALVAPESRLAVKVSGADDVEFCVREVGSELFVLACKREGKTVHVEFSGLPPNAQTAGQVLFEEPREVTAKNGSFKDWFAPFDVHVYRFRMK